VVKPLNWFQHAQYLRIVRFTDGKREGRITKISRIIGLTFGILCGIILYVVRVAFWLSFVVGVVIYAIAAALADYAQGADNGKH
jgi:type IV secretory pathway TrbD component